MNAPDSETKAQGLEGCCACGQDTPRSLCPYPPRSRNGYKQTVIETEEELEYNLRWASTSSRESTVCSNTPSRFIKPE